MKKYCLLLLMLSSINGFSQNFELLPANPDKVSFRGLSIFRNCIWVSGNNGTVGKSIDGGKSWNWMIVNGFEKNDFRDIEVFDDRNVVIMAVASPTYILRTSDGGQNWQVVYENKHPDMFLDAMAFKNNAEGMVIGDPINQTIFTAITKDAGRTWVETNKLQLPKAYSGENFFAASGTNITHYKNQYYIVTGGTHSRLFTQNKAITLPTTQGSQMTGANSIAFYDKNGMIASGDYSNREKKDSAFLYSNDGGKTWHIPQTPPNGYRSCVCFASKNMAVTCGITGIDITYDAGKTWKSVSKENFNVCVYSKYDKVFYFAGNNGRLGKLTL